MKDLKNDGKDPEIVLFEALPANILKGSLSRLENIQESTLGGLFKSFILIFLLQKLMTHSEIVFVFFH